LNFNGVYFVYIKLGYDSANIKVIFISKHHAVKQ